MALFTKTPSAQEQVHQIIDDLYPAHEYNKLGKPLYARVQHCDGQKYICLDAVTTDLHETFDIAHRLLHTVAIPEKTLENHVLVSMVNDEDDNKTLMFTEKTTFQDFTNRLDY